MEDLWHLPEEGQLAVDVIETPQDIVIRSAIAGVREEDIDIHLTDDTVSLRGKRHVDTLPSESVLHYSECFWGTFSRTIILPCHIRPDDAEATFHNGVLTLRIPKAKERVKVAINRTV